MRSAIVRFTSRRIWTGRRRPAAAVCRLSTDEWSWVTLSPLSTAPSLSPWTLQRQRLFSTNIATQDDFEMMISTTTTTEEEESFAPHRRFEDLDLHPKSLKALRRQGLHNLTEIQEKTFDVIVAGRDVVGRARTGTGKTLSFLLPALERVVRKQETLPSDGNISILVLSPTRELAAQIAKEAERLVDQHGPEITSQVVYGGSSRREDVDRFNKKLPTVLVATPGRLKDHLASTRLTGNKPFVDTLQNLQILVLDEMDRLLAMGFRRDITDILSCLPRNKRQTLLFSATLPQEVRDVMELATKPNYDMIDCIQEEDPASQTNAQTEQSHVVLPTKQFWTKSLEFLLDLVDKGDNKVMVFFPMTSMVQFYAQLFNLRFGRRVWELHGRMHQRERTTISGRFRNANKGILFTSDVSARGVDYPNVTHVVQIGACESRETYIHRLGRTGRAGKRGKGVLILPEVERDFLDELEGLDIPMDAEYGEQLVSMPPSKKLMNELGPVVQKIRSGQDARLEKSIHDTYQAMIAYYFQRCSNKREVVSTVNRLVEVMGLPELPAIQLHRAKKIGLDAVPGLNIQASWKDQNWTSGWGNDRPSTPAPTRFGKPYGDFDGKFGTGDRSDGRRNRSESGYDNDWRPEPPPRAAKSGHRSSSSWQGHGDRRDNNSTRHVDARDGGRPNRYNQAFSKVGWKKDEDDFPGKPAFAKKQKKGGTFQRWETPGEFRFRN